MAKRYTDSEKWKKKFLRSLPASYKLLWLYILDECDHSGIWIVDFEVAVLRLNEEVTEKEALQLFGNRVLPIDFGDRWFVFDFIEFQYGELKEENRAHQAVIKNLKKYRLLDEHGKVINIPLEEIKPLTSPLQGAKDKEKEKEKEKDKEKEKVEIFYPFNSETFKAQWNIWKDYKNQHFKFIYKSSVSEQAALQELGGLAKNKEETAIQIIHQSIANGYKGLFELKNNGKQITNTNDRADKWRKHFGNRSGLGNPGTA